MVPHYYRADYRVVARLIGANLNLVGDQLFTNEISDADDPVYPGAGNFMVDQVIVINSNINITTATAKVYTAPAAGGLDLLHVPLSGSLVFGGASRNYYENTAFNALLNSPTLYLNVDTPEGVAATCDVYIYGWTIPYRPI